MAGIMLRSLSNPRTPLPFISDPLSVSANIGCQAWSHPGPEERSTSGNHTSGGGGKTKHTPDSHRASPYPPLARSSSGYGSAAGLKRLAAVARSQSQTSQSQSLRRTASLQGGDTLAALQESCRNTSVPLSPPPHHHRRNSRTGSTPSSRALRPAPTLVNLDLLVCPPPAPPLRSDIRVDFPTPPPPAPTPAPARAYVPQPPQPLRRRSSLAPAETSPAAMVTRMGGSIALPSPPLALIGKKKRESLAQRTLRRTFERTPRGAQVKVLGAHAAVRMMTAMNENEEDDEAAVAASVVVVVDEDECMADADAWVELNEAPVAPISNAPPVRESPSPVLVEAPLPSHITTTATTDDMEWSMIDEDECRAG